METPRASRAPSIGPVCVAPNPPSRDMNLKRSPETRETRACGSVWCVVCAAPPGYDRICIIYNAWSALYAGKAVTRIALISITPTHGAESRVGAWEPTVLTFRSGRSRLPPRVSPQPAPRSPPPPKPSAPTWRRGGGPPQRSLRRRPWREVRRPAEPAVDKGRGISDFGGGSLGHPRQWLGVQRPRPLLLAVPSCPERAAMRALRRRGY